MYPASSSVVSAFNHAEVAHVPAFGDFPFGDGLFDGAAGFIVMQAVIEAALIQAVTHFWGNNG